MPTSSLSRRTQDCSENSVHLGLMLSFFRSLFKLRYPQLHCVICGEIKEGSIWYTEIKNDKMQLWGCAVATLKIHSDTFKCLKTNWLIIFSGQKTTFQVKSLHRLLWWSHRHQWGRATEKGDGHAPVFKVSTSKPSFDRIGISSLINVNRDYSGKKQWCWCYPKPMIFQWPSVINMMNDYHN